MVFVSTFFLVRDPGLTCTPRTRTVRPKSGLIRRLNCLPHYAWAKQTRSELQLRDVQAMITVQPDLDWAYIDRWAIRLTVKSLLSEMRR